MKLTNSKKGISLIVLVITIIIMIILATVVIVYITNTELINMTSKGKKDSDKANVKDGLTVDILTIQIEGRNPTNEEYEQMLDKYGDVIYSDDDETAIGVKISKDNDLYLYEIIEDERADGTWDGKTNTPKVISTKTQSGLIPVYWNSNGKEIYGDTGNNWYNYSQNKWANAVTKDENGNITAYFVWIPRFEYKIADAEVSVKFIPTSQTVADAGYTIHPAFTNGTSNNFANGEWDKELSGFWVAKYEAGYQASTITQNANKTLSLDISNSNNEIVYSDKNYTSYRDRYKTNVIGQNIISTNYSTQKISYPVFLPLTYTYNLINVGDSYTIAKEVSKTSSFYGLNELTESHLIKNSEYGAVIYLTQSIYGRNKQEVNINNYYTRSYGYDETGAYKILVTGIYANGTLNGPSQTLSNAYNTTIGVKGSSTGNITGVYDLNGGAWEMTPAYILNNASYLITSAKSFTRNIDNTEYITSSTKYATIYPYDSANDTIQNNFLKYKSYNSTRYGDAIVETSTRGDGDYGLNSDASFYPNGSNCFMVREGAFWDGSRSGIFAYYYASSYMTIEYGFRISLAF